MATKRRPKPYYSVEFFNDPPSAQTTCRRVLGLGWLGGRDGSLPQALVSTHSHCWIWSIWEEVRFCDHQRNSDLFLAKLSTAFHSLWSFQLTGSHTNIHTLVVTNTIQTSWIASLAHTHTHWHTLSPSHNSTKTFNRHKCLRVSTLGVGTLKTSPKLPITRKLLSTSFEHLLQWWYFPLPLGLVIFPSLHTLTPTHTAIRLRPKNRRKKQLQPQNAVTKPKSLQVSEWFLRRGCVHVPSAKHLRFWHSPVINHFHHPTAVCICPPLIERVRICWLSGGVGPWCTNVFALFRGPELAGMRGRVLLAAAAAAVLECQRGLVAAGGHFRNLFPHVAVGRDRCLRSGRGWWRRRSRDNDNDHQMCNIPSQASRKIGTGTNWKNREQGRKISLV